MVNETSQLHNYVVELIEKELKSNKGVFRNLEIMKNLEVIKNSNTKWDNSSVYPKSN